jgi:hypothetical protein
MLQIGLGFHDPAGCDDAVDVANQHFAEQSPGQANRVRGHSFARNSLDSWVKFTRRLAYDGSLLPPSPINTSIRQDSSETAAC